MHYSSAIQFLVVGFLAAQIAEATPLEARDPEARKGGFSSGFSAGADLGDAVSTFFGSKRAIGSDSKTRLSPKLYGTTEEIGKRDPEARDSEIDVSTDEKRDLTSIDNPYCHKEGFGCVTKRDPEARKGGFSSGFSAGADLGDAVSTFFGSKRAIGSDSKTRLSPKLYGTTEEIGKRDPEARESEIDVSTEEKRDFTYIDNPYCYKKGSGCATKRDPEARRGGFSSGFSAGADLGDAVSTIFGSKSKRDLLSEAKSHAGSAIELAEKAISAKEKRVVTFDPDRQCVPRKGYGCIAKKF